MESFLLFPLLIVVSPLVIFAALAVKVIALTGRATPVASPEETATETATETVTPPARQRHRPHSRGP